jgi:hypothetical protein
VTAVIEIPSAPGFDEPIRWTCLSEVRKWFSDEPGIHLVTDPDELVVVEGNLLTYGGASLLWEAVIGNGTATAAQALTFLNNGQARLAVGSGTTAAANTQTALVTESIRKAMDATYPQHTDATTAGAQSIAFRSTFGTSEANVVWAEWGILNAGTSGRMLNRVVPAGTLGTKTSGTWQLTVTLSLA